MSKWTEIRDKAIRWLLGQIGYYDCGPEDTNAVPPADGAGKTPPETPAGNPHDDAWDAPAATPPASPKPATRAPLGLASCWHGANASERMMNVLSPRMSEAKFTARLGFMTGRGCTAAHVFLANGGDGECAGYAGWNDADLPAMLLRARRLREAGLAVVPWIVADDSADLLRKLFADPAKLVGRMSGLLAGAPYVVLGLEMDEGGVPAQWQSVRDAVRKVYKGPIGVHHTSGNSFPFASLGDIVLGQLSPGCTASQVKAQVRAILRLGKRAVGFEYARGPSRKLCLAALEAGAEGVGNWDGGDVPGAAEDAAAAVRSGAADAVDYTLLDWRWGNFKGARATLSSARIKGLKVGPGSLSYAWERGSCADLDAACTHSNPCCTCALFCRVGGKWVGGKFEHISTDRTSRGLGNVQEGYGGWDPSALSRADKYAFVILDDGARRRTNVIVCGR